MKIEVVASAPGEVCQFHPDCCLPDEDCPGCGRPATCALLLVDQGEPIRTPFCDRCREDFFSHGGHDAEVKPMDELMEDLWSLPSLMGRREMRRCAQLARRGYARNGRGLVMASFIENDFWYSSAARFVSVMAEVGPADMPLADFTTHNDALQQMMADYDPGREYILRVATPGGPTGVTIALYRPLLEDSSLGEPAK